MKSIKAIILDIGGVMILGDNLDTHYQKMCKHLGLDYEKFMESRKRHIMSAAKNKISGKVMIRLIAKEMNLPYEKLLVNWIKYKKESIEKNVELEKMVKKLKRQGYVVGSCSNVIDIHQKACKEKGIYDVFKFNLFSFKEKCSKPDVRIYKILLKKLKLEAKQVAFIDDYQICLDGARKVGINTIRFKNNKQLFQDLNKLGVKVK